VAGRVPLAVGGRQRRVLDRDVRRVADHRVVAARRSAARRPAHRPRSGSGARSSGSSRPAANIVPGRVPCSSESPTATLIVNAGASSSRSTRRLERGDQQPEPGDRHGERVEVHPVDRIQRVLGQHPRRGSPGSPPATAPSSRSNAPSRKWPDPQVGSIIRTWSSPNVSIAGSSVRSRMNSSTNSGSAAARRSSSRARTGPGRGRRGTGCPTRVGEVVDQPAVVVGRHHSSSSARARRRTDRTAAAGCARRTARRWRRSPRTGRTPRPATPGPPAPGSRRTSRPVVAGQVAPLAGTGQQRGVDQPVVLTEPHEHAASTQPTATCASRSSRQSS
jgi:hypothetical protein